jgi:hypothetical protein
MIDRIIEIITTNQVVMIVLVILGAIALLMLLKKLFKFALLVILVLAGMVAYVYLTDDHPKERLDEMIDKSKKTVIQAKSKAEELSKDLLKKVSDLDKKDMNEDSVKQVKELEKSN